MPTHLLPPRSRPNHLLGYSLKYAYQPCTDQNLQIVYQAHPCPACGTVSRQNIFPEPPLLQLDSVFFKVFPKPCGCGFTQQIFIVLNSVLQQTEPQILSAQEAIAQAELTHQLPDPCINEQLVAAQVALHHHQVGQAIALNQSLTQEYPNLFLPFYNLGVLYAQQEDYPESIAAYDKALALNPNHGDTLSGKANAQLQALQLQDAGKTYEHWRQLNSEGTVILARMPGQFGMVQVLDTPDFRSLCINEQVQGTFYKRPAAPEFEPHCRTGPGALAPNVFAAGALLLGTSMPQSSGLVLGLGCGAALVMNLACFPEMHLTVVEIDPVVIRLCLTFFPLVQHYVEQGRLEIIEADAIAFLASNTCQFDFVQFDVYQGIAEVPADFQSVEFIRQMGRTAPTLFCNIIGKLSDPTFHQILGKFDQAGQALCRLYPSQPMESHHSIDLNWLGSTKPLRVPERWSPFPHLSNGPVKQVQQNFMQVQNHACTRESLKSYKLESV